MSVDTAVARFRQRQANVFRSSCIVTRPFGDPVFNPATGTYTQPTTTIYSGPCSVRPMRGNAQDVEAGAVEQRIVHYLGKLPVDTAVLRGDTLTVTAAAYDSALVARAFHVQDATGDDWQIVRRLTLEEVNPDG